jgi:uncharacterized protein (DUF2252 family)
MSPVVDSILKWHRGRDPMLLGIKWRKISADVFAFFRGTAPLFYADWSREKLPSAPVAWICGDVHLENIGSYKSEDGVARFDLNDFDEACLAPVHWETGRALTGLHLAGKARLAEKFLEAYLETLVQGKAVHIEAENIRGPIYGLLKKVEGRKRGEFLEERVKAGKLLIRKDRSYALGDETATKALNRYLAWAGKQTDREFYRPLDICGRIAGNGSLGLERYMVLIQGKKSPRILDLKQMPVSAAASYFDSQSAWRGEAHRVFTLQHGMQYRPPAHLAWTGSKTISHLIRELQPAEDRIDLAELGRKDWPDFVVVWARLIASAHLRSAGWKNGAKPEELAAYVRSCTASGRRRLLAAAEKMAARQEAMFREFCREMK